MTGWYKKSVCVLALIDLIGNILARFPSACDYYTDHFFGIWLETVGRITAQVPFSVGEFLLIAAILAVLCWGIGGIGFIFWRNRIKFRYFIIGYSKGMVLFLLVVLLVMTLNCSMLYGCSKLDINGGRQEKFSTEDVRTLWNYVAGQCNRLAFEVERDENGKTVCQTYTNRIVKEAMRRLSDSYPRLRGTYPDPKPIHFSKIMYQANCTGVYFPFSLEANYNTYLSDLGYPATVAHELAHLKGYIYEDEADFIAYLACIGSTDPYVQYSGYLSVLGYLQGDYQEVCQTDDRDTVLSEKVYEDFSEYYYTKEVRDKLDAEDTVLDQKTVEALSDGVTDAYMDYYDAEPNYDEVTRLMLAYYDGIL